MGNRRVFIKQLSAGTIILSVSPAFISCNRKRKKQPFEIIPSNPLDLPRSTPEEQGILSGAVGKFIDSFQKSKIELHSIMLVRNGHVITEGWWSPYAAEYKQQLYSLSKSFTSLAVGFAIEEGLLSLDDKVIYFFQDDLPDQLSENLKKLKVKHLLTMSVGQETDPITIMEKTKNWARAFLNIPIVNEPGSTFLYNSGASYMLSAIISKVAGESLHKFLKPRLFDPLNITGSTWSQNSQGVNIGASHLRLKNRRYSKIWSIVIR